MANPQIENGHTKIANELYEASFKVRIPIYDYIIWHCILRNTYGYHKKENWVSLSRISEMTGINISNVSRSKKHLLNNNMIVDNANNLGIQKDYTKWKCKMVTKQTIISIGVISTDNSPRDNIPRDSASTDKITISRDNKKICRDNKNLSPEITNKDSKDNIKENIKDIGENKNLTFEEYIERTLKPLFPNLDLKIQLDKFNTYWSESNKKVTRPKSAFRNWCERAEKYRLADTKNNGHNPQETTKPVIEQLKEKRMV